MVVLGLGTNLGDREKYLQIAIATIKERQILHDIRLSKIYESKALLLAGSPAEWDINFLNMAISGETNLTPQELLKSIKDIEKEIGRQERSRWAPREIDIDILAMDDLVLTQDDLTIPHQHLVKRAFALLPFADLDPNWQYPVQGEFHSKTIAELAQNISIEETKSYE